MIILYHLKMLNSWDGWILKINILMLVEILIELTIMVTVTLCHTDF